MRVKMPYGAIEQRFSPIGRVGIYAPGGRAAYPSSLLMCAVPANVAGVEEIAVCTPPAKDGKCNQLVLAAARICGITRIFKVGGAQAVAALAFGTETVPKVDKIVGPGNIYVMAAKNIVRGSGVDIDVPAGPSEVLIIADNTARADFIAADMLAQAEHDPNAAAVAIVTSRQLAERIKREA